MNKVVKKISNRKERSVKILNNIVEIMWGLKVNKIKNSKLGLKKKIIKTKIIRNYDCKELKWGGKVNKINT